MNNITANQAFKEVIPLPSELNTATLTFKVYLGSDGSVFASGVLTYLAGIQWTVEFTPDTVNEIYILEVSNEDGDVIFSQSYKALGAVWDAAAGPTGTIVVGTNSFCTAQEAEDYFATRFGVGTKWSALTSAEKISALVTAYKYLTASDKFSLPTDTSLFVDAIKDAQCETALFLVDHQEDMDARKGLQAQGVTQSGVVEETYDKDMINDLPIPAKVYQLLKGYSAESPIGSAQLERDDDES